MDYSFPGVIRKVVMKMKCRSRCTACAEEKGRQTSDLVGQVTVGRWLDGTVFDFHTVKAFAINACYGTERNEGGRVAIVDDLHDSFVFSLSGKHEKHFRRIARIGSLGFEPGAAATGFIVDAAGYFIVFLGNDEELDGSVHGMNDLIDTEGGDIEYHVAEDDTFPIFQNNVAGGDDDDVTDHNDVTQGDVAVLVDDSSHDVGAAGTAVGGETQSHAATAKHGSDDARHERLVAQQRQRSGKITRQRQRQGEYRHTENRLHAKPPAQDLQGNRQQNDVDGEVSDLCRYLQHTPFEDGSDAGYTAGSDVVGEQKDRPADTIGQHGNGYHEVIANFPVDGFARDRRCIHFLMGWGSLFWLQMYYIFFKCRNASGVLLRDIKAECRLRMTD